MGLGQGLTCEQQLGQSVELFAFGALPQTAGMGLQEPLRHVPQGPGVAAPQEGQHRRIP